MLKRIQRKTYSLHSLHSGYWNLARSMAVTVAFHIRPVILRAVHPSFPIMAISRKRLLWFVWLFYLCTQWLVAHITRCSNSHHLIPSIRTSCTYPKICLSIAANIRQMVGFGAITSHRHSTAKSWPKYAARLHCHSIRGIRVS